MNITPETRPPLLARWLLRTFLSPAEHVALLGDLDERHQHWCFARGRRIANLRYWRETLAAVGRLSAQSHSPELDRVEDSGMRNLLVGLSYALRGLRRAPTHTTVCVLTLGLAFGGVASVASVAGPLLVNPVPYQAADRLGLVFEKDSDGSRSNTGFATFRDLQSAMNTVDASAVFSGWQPTLSDNESAERIEGLRVSAGYFRTLGVRPAIGRDFATEEDVPGASRVIMLSHALWVRRFGADSSLVGGTIDIEGASHLVAGVLPATYDDVLAPRAQVWRVLGYGEAQPWACRTCRHLRMVVRAKEGVALSQVQAEVSTVMAQLAATYPTEYPSAGGFVVPMREQVVADAQPIMVAVGGAALILLLFAIVNVTHLQFARAMRREGEFAIRIALGATRVRIARQLLAEAALLVALSTVIGVLFAVLSTPLIVSWLPPSLPRLAAISVDGKTLGMLATLSALSTVIIGTLPAWRTEPVALADSLRSDRRIATAGRRLLRDALVVTEVALALMLLIGTGLLGRSLLRLYAVDGGFESARLLTMQIQSTGPRYDGDARVHAYHDAVITAVQSLPGIEAIGLANQLPMDGNFDTYGINAEDKPLANPELAPSADRYSVTPGFLRAMGTSIRRGRDLAPEDDRDSARAVVVVSEALATRIWPGEDPLGKRIRVGGSETAPWREVVGVAENVRHDGLDSDRTLQVYVPTRQWFFADNIVTLVIRTTVDPSSMRDAVLAAVRSVDRIQPVMRVATMEQVVMRSVGQRRLALALFAAFAGLSAFLAAIGLYGLIAGDVEARRREIGVRMALGSGKGQIVRLLARQATRLIVFGAVAGVAGALVLGRFVEALLFEVRTTDVPTLLGVVITLVLLGGAATLIPALRALRIDPAEALRSD